MVMVLTPYASLEAGDHVLVDGVEGSVTCEGEALVVANDGRPLVLDPSDRIFARRPLVAGLPATASLNGDYYPVTVKTVSLSGHRVEVEMMQARGGGLFTGTGRCETYSRRADGCYREQGRSGGFRLTFGKRISLRSREF